ncbi:MAG TPA: hypothetical protein ENK31_05515 [Nannocystis exedens]|nr:hypothetical protein [Nannocystis exedens]
MTGLATLTLLLSVGAGATQELPQSKLSERLLVSADPADPAEPAEPGLATPEGPSKAKPEPKDLEVPYDPENEAVGPEPADPEFDEATDTNDPKLSAEQDTTFESVSPARPHFVFVNTYGVTFGINTIGSFDSAFFFGAALKRRAERSRRWALGYQLTLSAGGAERYLSGLLTIRHHLAAYTYSPSKRLFGSVGAGLALFFGLQPAVLEAEGRLGFVFGRKRRDRRLAGIAGGMLRLGWHFHNDELIPMPQVGAFIGFAVR